MIDQKQGDEIRERYEKAKEWIRPLACASKGFTARDVVTRSLNDIPTLLDSLASLREVVTEMALALWDNCRSRKSQYYANFETAPTAGDYRYPVSSVGKLVVAFLFSLNLIEKHPERENWWRRVEK